MTNYEEPKVNVLTNKLVEDLYASLDKNKTIGRLNFKIEELADVLFTIYTINNVGFNETHINDVTLVAGYEIPTFLEGMVFPRITLKGTEDGVNLAVWSVEKDFMSKRILSKSQMLDMITALYGCVRKPAEKTVLGATNVGTAVADIHAHIVQDGFVSSNHTPGLFPVVLTTDFVRERYLGRKVEYAFEDFIISVIAKLKA